ncbi:putative TetR family transcriptional regulator [Streptomyces lydicamycinicus]|uniref:Putative TetR family transcriptional regulator n=1 Tax=Streptomyces lydicamycinicus TaxID=1546107 RepID=A0A0P4R7Y2_9ACTN|nr:TetR/AcrR family transcriptional regulator [Streptomyces lydicamycinicus]GAO09341.1 putative TetR family transcriptional regulator [Streptomyces lydicamycinicus]
MGAVKSKRVPRAVREQQMLDAAVLTFARRGYRAASMDEIAELAGVSKPLVYLYLNSKEDLFNTVIRRESAALVAAVTSAVEPGAAADRQLCSGLKGFFAHTAEHPYGWAVLHQQARTHGEPFAREVAALRAEIVAFVTELLGAAAKEAGCVGELVEREVAGLAHALVGAAESLAEWANVRTDEGASGDPEHPSAKDTAATMMNFAWMGLNQLMGGERWVPGGLVDHESRSCARR